MPDARDASMDRGRESRGGSMQMSKVGFSAIEEGSSMDEHIKKEEEEEAAAEGGVNGHASS